MYVRLLSVLLSDPQRLTEDAVFTLDLLFDVLMNLEVHRLAVEAKRIAVTVQLKHRGLALIQEAQV